MDLLLEVPEVSLSTNALGTSPPFETGQDGVILELAYPDWFQVAELVEGEDGYGITPIDPAHAALASRVADASAGTVRSASKSGRGVRWRKARRGAESSRLFSTRYNRSMGGLLHGASGRRVPLLPHTLVGRGPAAQVRLKHEDVSSTHAAITWTASGWQLRDLGSRNGTWVDGAAVEAGQDVRLFRGCVLRFGPDEWTMEDDAAPRATATAGDHVVHEHEGLLLLPPGEEPSAIVYHDADLGWTAEVDEASLSVSDGESLRVADVDYVLHLPEPIEATHEGMLPEIGAITLHLGVSMDEEEVSLRVSGPAGWSVNLQPRSYHYMILTLARLREGDAALPPEERGWVHREELARMLRVSTRLRRRPDALPALRLPHAAAGRGAGQTGNDAHSERVVRRDPGGEGAALASLIGGEPWESSAWRTPGRPGEVRAQVARWRWQGPWSAV